jgi:predicted ATPase
MLTERFEDLHAADAGGTTEPVAPPCRPCAQPPVPLTPLVGRDREVADVLGLFARPEVRLVTLTGPGGIGKTRVALEVVHRLAAAGTTVAWVGSIATLRNVDLVASAIAQALRIDERPGQDTLHVLVDELRDASAVLALDGFEPVLAAADDLARLLVDCPGLRLIVTSRAVLNLRAEHDYPISPLALPRRDDPRLEDADAVRLFVETATAAAPAFHLTDDNAPAVAEICRRLDGIPLAIELAAPRVRLLTTTALLARLSSRLDLLTGGAADLPERHQTLRAALAWDYDLLDGDERALFRRLAVCEGGFGLPLAEAVAGAAGGIGLDLLDGLESLVGKSLLRHRRLPGALDRFALLDTVREYALERLAESGEERAARDAHAAYLLGRLEMLDLHGPTQVDALDEVAREHANFRAALRWTIESGDTATELRLVARLAFFWRHRGYLAEGAQWVTQTLGRTGGVEDASRVELLVGAAQFDRARGDFAAAQALLEQAQPLAERLGERAWLALAHHDLGAVLGESGNHEGAQREAAVALSLYDALADDSGRARAFNALGVEAHASRDFGAALTFYRSSLDLLVGRDSFGVALLLMNIGCVMTDVGQADVARALLERSLRLWRRLGNAWYGADCLEFLAYALSASGASEEAVRMLGTAAALRVRIGAARAPAQQPDYDAWVARLKSAVGESAFAAAWQRGMQERVDGPDDAVGGDPSEVDDDLMRLVSSLEVSP